MKYRMLIPCCPHRVGKVDVNLKMYRWCRDHLYEFVGYEKYTTDDGRPVWTWVMEKVLTEREEKIASQAYDTGKWVAQRQKSAAVVTINATSPFPWFAILMAVALTGILGLVAIIFAS